MSSVTGVEEIVGKTELEILVKSLSVSFNKQHKDLFQVETEFFQVQTELFQ